jgi:hypothetical protein
MPAHTNPLEQVKVAAPCPADWEKMVGDERVRYCDRCSLHVYNLSGMTRREAEGLVASAEGRLCVRFYRRADGTILTRNCPVGLSALKRRAAHAATATLTAVLGFFTGLGLNFGLDRALSPSIMEASAVPAPPMPPVNPLDAVEEVEVTLGEMVPQVKMGRVVVGDVSVPKYEHQFEDPAARGERKTRRQR